VFADLYAKTTPTVSTGVCCTMKGDECYRVNAPLYSDLKAESGSISAALRAGK